MIKSNFFKTWPVSSHEHLPQATPQPGLKKIILYFPFVLQITKRRHGATSASYRTIHLGGDTDKRPLHRILNNGGLDPSNQHLRSEHLCSSRFHTLHLRFLPIYVQRGTRSAVQQLVPLRNINQPTVRACERNSGTSTNNSRATV